MKGMNLYVTLTAQTGSLVSPTRKVTSHNSGIEAKNFMSSASPVLFSNVDRSGSTSGSPDNVNTSGIFAKNKNVLLIVGAFNWCTLVRIKQKIFRN